MSVKTDADYLRDMLHYAERAVAFTEGRSERDLATDDEFSFALLHCFMIIGEAAAKVSEPTRSRTPAIAWKQIIGMRQWVVHRYDRVDDQIVWKTAVENLPDLIARILEFLPPEQT